MSQETIDHHIKAAEHRVLAVRHNQEAANHHASGSHEKARHHAHLALGHHLHASYHAEAAAKIPQKGLVPKYPPSLRFMASLSCRRLSRQWPRLR
jgi:hypothetical protein